VHDRIAAIQRFRDRAELVDRLMCSHLHVSSMATNAEGVE
jgi:hypothetical protein